MLSAGLKVSQFPVRIDGPSAIFMVSADELKNHPVVQDIAEQILKQTIECRYFVQEYTRGNFGGTARASNNIWLGNS